MPFDIAGQPQRLRNWTEDASARVPFCPHALDQEANDTLDMLRALHIRVVQLEAQVAQRLPRITWQAAPHAGAKVGDFWIPPGRPVPAVFMRVTLGGRDLWLDLAASPRQPDIPVYVGIDDNNTSQIPPAPGQALDDGHF